MHDVTLRPLRHKGRDCIGIYFEILFRLQAALQGTGLVRFSATHKCWYAPYSPENLSRILSVLEGKALVTVTGFDRSADSSPKQPHEQMKEAGVPDPAPVVPVPRKQKEDGTGRKKAVTGATIHPVNAHVLPAMEQQLKLKAYSPSTIRTYLQEVAAFLRTVGPHAAAEFTVSRIKDYLQYCLEKLQLTENTLHSRMNALKFYYEQVLGREKFFWDIPRPKKHEILPRVLSKEEMIRLLKAIENKKHKTMVMLGYACGLRVSEIIGLKPADVDQDRRLIFIRRAKGKKDRVVSLSPLMLVMLRDYLAVYKPATWLFEGQYPGTPYSSRSIQAIVSDAKAKAGIEKQGSTHMLRHSFATHLIDKGTDVVFIQKLLGHNDIKTTLRYLHVTNKDLVHILSPIEDLKDFL